MVGEGEEGIEVREGVCWDGVIVGGGTADGDEVHMEGGEELDESAGDGAEAEEEGGFTEEEVRVGAGGGGGPVAGGELVEGGEGELASEGEHHGQEVLGAGFGDQGRVEVAAGGDKPIQTASLEITDAGVLDLADNDLIIHATAETRSDVLGQVCAWIKSGRAGGTWSGKGIVSSVGQTGHFPGLAAVVNEKLYGGPIVPSLGGEALTTNDIIVTYTYDVDMNLDGVVNADDYFLIDSNFIPQAKGYQNGDFNYDGVVNADDYFLIDSVFLGQTGPLAGGESAAATTHAAPEPADSAAVEDVVIVQPAKKQEADSLLAELFSTEPVP